MKMLSVNDWPNIIRSGTRVLVGSGVSVPRMVVDSMLEACLNFEDIQLVHSLPVSPLPWLDDRYRGHIRTNTFYLNEELHLAVENGRADYTPCSTSEIPQLFARRHLPLDAVLVQVTPPDSRGYCSLGANVDVAPAAIDSAKTLVAQINRQLPRTHGGSTIHRSEIDYYLECDTPLPEQPVPQINDTIRRIGGYVAQIVEDGCTLHAGPGAIAQKTLAALRHHQHLGIHSSLFSTDLMRLVRCGAVDNSLKTIHPGKIIADHCEGTRELYDFIDGNPDLEVHPSEYVACPERIGRNRAMVSINEAIVADLTGQVASDSLGRSFYHGIGEQIDFLRGSAKSEGGRPIVVLASTTLDGKKSRIMASLGDGTGVVTGRVDVHYIITEHGVATLYGRTVRERVLAMIQVAHPDFREDLLRDAHERGWVPPFLVHPGKSVEPRACDGIESRKVELGGKPYILRPLHPKDIRRVQEFFYSHEPETIRMRYGHMLGRMSPEAAYKLVNIDHHQGDLALGLFERQGRNSIIRAMAGYYQDGDGKSAEVAFVVDERLRRCGVASTLLASLADFAKSGGIKRFWAQVHRRNHAMLALFHKFDARQKNTPGGQSIEVTLKIPLPAPPCRSKKKRRGQ